ncbi:unnamed protein product [Cylindrotheca closterium]|uniref:PDZ GRASP-type domain-containing protein n=1 Tax=Cylindrotheca closterium TaxID=2856 RepID=A0AAD2FS76_9STRA|nr:unnamed protein product [Cylindrotheca closterium]
MGNTATSEANDEDDFAEFDGIETLGYRVLGVQPESPAAKAGLVSFFDFIVGANGEMLLGSGQELEEGEEYDDIDFPMLLKENKGKPVGLLVWNIKCQEKREVELIPNDDWPGAGLLGVTIRLDNYGGADERLIKVLSVEEKSPASIAGLVPMRDFLLGTTIVSFASTDVLANTLNENYEEVVEIYVYNSESDIVRVVALMPTTKWRRGGGMLGAEVGTGYLHRLPHSCRTTVGQSVERKVRAAEVHQNDDKPQKVPVMESHLEMEIEQGTTGPESMAKQPHELGTVETSPQAPTDQHDTRGKLPAGIPPPPKAQGADSAAPTTPAKPFPPANIDESIRGGEQRAKFAGLPTPPQMKY